MLSHLSRRCRRIVLAAGMLAPVLTSLMAANDPPAGSISGAVVGGAKTPAAYVTVELRSGDAAVQHTITDARGTFTFENVAPGEYRVSYGAVGGERVITTPLTITPSRLAVELGQLKLAPGDTVQMEKVEVSARREALFNSIDRKVYQVGRDVQSAAGSASDLLQNVPSIQVDVEGNVSLRGDGNVLILVNGKSSAMMGRNRAAVLAQMPADTIERVEVITNPSAKYKPDGTAGIINLVMKKKAPLGYSGSARVMAGMGDRFSAGVIASVNPGRYTIFGSASVRRDFRPRSVSDERTHLDPASGALVSTSQQTHEESRPLSRMAQGGFDYEVDKSNKVGATVNYNHRDFVRHATVTNGSRLPDGTISSDYDRLRTAPESEKDLEFTGKLQHAFAGEDHELNIELKHDRTTEKEDSHYLNVYRVPRLATRADASLIQTVETGTELTAEYTRPLGEEAKLEAGYNGERNELDTDFRASVFDAASGAWRVDTTNSNRFLYVGTIHAVYGTYARKVDRFGFLAGLRAEQALIHTRQVTTGRVDDNDYTHLYPSLHLKYDLTEVHQLQLNYSHRVHRPDGDDLNPFPQYQDPFNLSAGNPHLRPEDVHSLEGGYHYQDNGTTYLAAIYYRYRYHGMTEVSRYLDAETLLTTKENLGTSRSGGLELAATTRLRDRVGLNLSGNVYRNEIDASNLGFAARRAITAWDAKANVNWDVTKRTLMQLNANYTAKRLTPQGYREPTFIANLGLRHNLADKKTSFILTASDVFNTLRERTHIETPALRRDITRRRSSSIIYAGVIYTFGKPPKKPKDDLQFDTTL